MIICSHYRRSTNIIALLLMLFGSGVMINRFFTNTTLDLFWIIISCFIGYGIVLLSSDLFVSFFKSPEWIEIRANSLIIKMLFKESYIIDIIYVNKICKKKFYQLSGSFDIIISIPEKNIFLYFDKRSFYLLDEFIHELKKANPKCQIDEWLI